MTSTIDTELESFIERCMAALSHQVQGDSQPLLAMWSRADDVAILGAIGSHAQGWEDVRTHLLGAARQLDWTELSVERPLTTTSGDLAVTSRARAHAPPARRASHAHSAHDPGVPPRIGRVAADPSPRQPGDGG
jgi:hypothetical protein